jgi:hypothetical protein
MASLNWRGLAMTSDGLRFLQDLRRIGYLMNDRHRGMSVKGDIAAATRPATTENRRDTVEGLNRRTFLHPPDVQLQMRAAGSQRIQHPLSAPGEIAA